MDLKLKEIAQLLKVSEKTIYRWIKGEKIPFYRINHQYRFRTDEISQWAAKNKYEISDIDVEINDDKPITIIDSLNNGGIYYHLSGATMVDALTNVVNVINIPIGLGKDDLLNHLLRREDMASTGVGNGIAFPHPRNPLVADVNSESLTICFLNKTLEDQTLDGIPIHTLFIILSATQKRHLQLLSKLSFVCQQQAFIKLLKSQPLREDVIDYLESI